MHGLTQNEARVMDFLVRNINERNSINEIGRRLDISPMGIYKILKNLESVHAVIPEVTKYGTFYRADFQEEIGSKLSELVLIQNELNDYSKVLEEDLEQLKSVTLSCILFGSVIKEGSKARDIDVLLVLEKRNFKKVHNKLEEIKELKPKKIHDVMMTKEDLAKNIRKKDEVVLDIIRTGKVLWGSEIIVEAIKNGAS